MRLDSHTSVEIMALLQHLNRRGATIVVVTHEEDIAEHCSRIVTVLGWPRARRSSRDESNLGAAASG